MRAFIALLQLIYLTFESVEEYDHGKSHARIAAPAVCPNCQTARSLRALGYYFRYTTRESTTGTPAIAIRRFRCMVCRRTTSLLPSFAQPYRLVLNATIQRFVAGDRSQPDVARSVHRLHRYWRQYVDWLPTFRMRIHQLLRATRRRTAEAVWEAVVKWAGSLADATLWLTRNFGITMFGEYKCHLPNPP